MVILSSHLVDTSAAASLQIGGRGGQEMEIGQAILPTARRVSASLYDYEILDVERLYRIEIKKQSNDQWFDIAKYHDLTETARQIVILFVIHNQGRIETLACITLGDMLDALLKDTRYERYGWSRDVIQTAFELKRRCPELQFKSKLKVKKFLKETPSLVQVLYERVEPPTPPAQLS